VTGNSYPTQISTLLTDLTYDLGLEQVVNFPTRGQNTLDIFLANGPSLISKCKPIPGISDHDIIFTETLTRVPHQKNPSRRILLWKRVDTEGLQRAVHDFSDNFVSKYSSSTDIETLWTSFLYFCVKAISDFIPSKLSSSRYSQPWVNHKVKRLSRRQRRAHKKGSRTGDPADINCYRQLQKDTKSECRKAYNFSCPRPSHRWQHVKEVVLLHKEQAV